MPAPKPSPEAGKRLRAARLQVQLSTRDVERLSQKLAQEKRNQEYYISHAWLTQIEGGEFTPSIYKFYSLSIIYKRGYDEILGFFEIHIGDIGREQMWLTLPHTHLIGGELPSASQPIEIPPQMRGNVQIERTNLVSQMFHQWGALPIGLPPMNLRNSLYGYVGTEDFTLYPLIRPGSFVEIDPHQKKVDASGWSNQFDRPIYFVELRNTYACAWCELSAGRLLLVPYPQAGNQVRAVRFPEDAGIIGRVTAVLMRIAETKQP